MFNLFDETRGFVKSLINDYNLECDHDDTTLEEAFDMCEDAVCEYEYSVYTAVLLEAMSDDLDIWVEFVEICKEFGDMNILYVNEAIVREMRNQYGDKTLKWFLD